MKYWFKLIYRE